MIIASSSQPLLLTEHTANDLVEVPLKLNVENKRLAVLCSHWHKNLKFGNFLLSFGRLCMSKISTNMCAACVFFVIEPIK